MTSISAPMAARSPLALPAQAWVQLVATLAIFALVLFNANVLNDADTYWHLAAGGWMLENRQVLRHDVFSHTWAGRPWISHEWLSEVVMALAYRAGGWSGLLVLFGLAAASTVALLARGLGRFTGWVGLALGLALAFGLIGPSLLTRPHLLALPLLVAWTLEILAARTADRPPRLFMPVLMALWANLHGSYALGFAVMAPFALEALIEGRKEPWRVIRGWGGVGLLCVAAAAMTPHGVAGLIYPLTISSMATLHEIVEWRPADFSSIRPFEMALLATLFICLSRGVKVPVLRLLLLLALLHMSLQHTRHQMVLAVVAPLLLVEPIALALGRARMPQAATAKPLAVFVLVAVALTGVRFAAPVVRPDGPVTPRSALAHVPATLATRPVFNSYGFGGYLIAQGVRPFIDGRSDMYGDAFFQRFLAAERGGAAFDAVAAEHRIEWTILAAGTPLAREMDRKAGWRRVWSDNHAVVHAREGALERDPLDLNRRIPWLGGS